MPSHRNLINDQLMFQLYGRSTFGRLASPRINVHQKAVVDVKFKEEIVFSVFASDAFCGSLSEPIDSTVFVRERVLRHKRARSQ